LKSLAKIVAVLLLVAPARGPAASERYVTQSLTATVQGVSGTAKIEVLRDRTLKTVEHAPLDIDGPEKDYLPAQIRVVDGNGAVIKLKTLERPEAKLSWSKLDGPGPVLELTVDYTTGFGTYNGPITFFLLLGKGPLEFLKVPDGHGVLPKELRLMDNGYRALWKVKDLHTILAAFASVDSSGEGGELSLSRFSLEDGVWVAHRRKGPGQSDFESSVPKDSDYP